MSPLMTSCSTRLASLGTDMTKKKLKPVLLADIKVGLQVVVNDSVSTTFYTINETVQDGRVVHLYYSRNKRDYSCGWLDYGICFYPSDAQLKYAKEHKHED